MVFLICCNSFLLLYLDFRRFFLKTASPNCTSFRPQDLDQPYLGWENDAPIRATKFWIQKNELSKLIYSFCQTKLKLFFTYNDLTHKENCDWATSKILLNETDRKGQWLCVWWGEQGQEGGRSFITSFSYNILFGCWVTKSCPTLCDLMDCSTPGSSVLQNLSSLLKFMSTGSVMLSHPLLPLSPSTFNLSQHQGLFQSQLFASGGSSIWLGIQSRPPALGTGES